MATTNCVLSRVLVYNIFVCGCATIGLSFTKTRVLGYGHMIHPIFHWEHVYTPLVAVGSLIATCGSYIMLCKLDEMFKYRHAPG